MKVHEFSNGFSSWDQHDSQSSLSLSCKRLRPLAPKLSGSPSSPPSSSSGVTSATFDLKSFIRPDQTGPRKFEYPVEHKRDPPQVSSLIVHSKFIYILFHSIFLGKIINISQYKRFANSVEWFICPLLLYYVFSFNFICLLFGLKFSNEIIICGSRWRRTREGQDGTRLKNR